MKNGKGRSLSEKEIQKSILDYLTYKKFIPIKFNNVGIFIKSTGSYIPPRNKGISDILACSPTGTFWAIEVKAGYNKPSPEQVAFIETIRKNKGIAFVAYSLQDVETMIQEHYG